MTVSKTRGYQTDRIGPSAIRVIWPRLDSADAGEAFRVPLEFTELSVTFSGDFGNATGSEIAALFGTFASGVATELGGTRSAASWHVAKDPNQQPANTIWPVVAPGGGPVSITCELIASKPSNAA
jgi:hypothetical protein